MKQIRGTKYLIVNRHGKAHWFGKSKLVGWTEYLIDNVYIKVGNNVYRQTIGIPMGTDCALQLANLFLFHYEYLYMKNLMRDNLCMAKRFSDTVRYIDDLLTLNNSNFEEEVPNTYPGLYTGFLPRGANLEYVKKRGGEAVRSCRAAAGGWVQEGDVPPPAQIFYLSEIHLDEL